MTGASSNYLKYIHGEVKKQDRHKDSTLLDFALAAPTTDSSFKALARGAYIKLDTVTYPSWFTGYVTNEPSLEFFGKHPTTGVPVYGYQYEATSDEYILSLKPIGFVEPFLNVTMGQVLKILAGILCPGIFDVTGVQDGPTVAAYVIDPDKKFVDVVNDFCDSANYRFWAHDHKLFFAAQDASTVTIDTANKHFTPSRLSLKPTNTPLINDITVLGDIEPREYIHEYLLGTGLDASFPLIASVYGADTSVLLDEVFSGSAINSQVWTIPAPALGQFAVDSGYLNCLGGGSGVYIRTNNFIPLEGRLRITHGEWDFLSGDGVIGGLWTGNPIADLTGCVYGLKVVGTTINPVVNGSADSAQSISIDHAKRYVLRTIVEFTKTNRLPQTYSYISATGTRGQYGGGGDVDTAIWSTVITEVDPANGSITNQWTFQNKAALDNTQLYATYSPVLSTSLHATVTAITISTPLSATLETSSLVYFNNTNFDAWDNDTTPSLWLNAVGANKEDVFSDSGSACKFVAGSDGQAYVSQSAAGIIQPNTKYLVSVRVRGAASSSPGKLRIYLKGTGLDTSLGLVVLHSATSASAYKTFNATLTPAMGTVPSDAELFVHWDNANPGNALWVDQLVFTTGWEPELVGPNELDAMDGLTPVATIISQNVGADTRSTLYGTPQFNPGQAQLVFFKDSVTRTSQIPPKDVLIRLSYRAAGSAVGRAVNRTSVYTESVKWGDNGYRSQVRTDFSPRPRSSGECEMAAASLVQENSTQHYDGTYTQYSPYFSAEPTSGSVIKFINTSGDLAALQAEEISQVSTAFICKNPELFEHEVQFGKPDHSRQLMQQFSSTKGVFQRSSGNNNGMIPVDIGVNGDPYADDVVKPSLVIWDDSNLYFDAGEDLGTSKCWEIRYTDEGWGCDDGKNLISRVVSRTFTVPRALRGKIFCIKRADFGNYNLWSEDLTQSNYSGGSVTKALGINPDGNISEVCSVALTGGAPFSTSIEVMPPSSPFCWSFSIKGPAGTSMSASFGGTTKAFTLSGAWQRISLSATGVPPGVGTITASTSVTVQMTRFSAEKNTTVETLYTKTRDQLYGPVSRFAAVVHVSFPAPDNTTASVDATALSVRPTYS